MTLRNGLCLCTLVLAVGLPICALADIDVSGGLRDDAFILGQGAGAEFGNILESKIILERDTEKWKYYSDLRLYANHGNLLASAANVSGPDFYSFRLLRGFVRHYTDLGDFSMGKTYVNFGVAGVFNPFEIDRSFNPTDLNYTKEGILALACEKQLGSLSGLKAYVGPATAGSGAAAGASWFTHVAAFDVGAVVNRRNVDDALAGVYFQGDAEVGLQGAWAFHWRNSGGAHFSEANLGVDYSFFAGKLIAAVLAYYHEVSGDSTASEISASLSSGSAGSLSAFTGKFYGYAYILLAPDEFFQARLDAFLNGVDASGLLIPSATWVLADGLNLTVQAIFPTGIGSTQFSRNAIADYVGLVRIEAKL